MIRIDYLILGGIVCLLMVAVIGLGASLSDGVDFQKWTTPDDEPVALVDTTEAVAPPAPSLRADAMRPFGPRAAREADSILAVLYGYPLETGPALDQDYSDPVGGGMVPLISVQGREDEYLSPNFKISDVTASDGAAYARISPRLINTLEVLTRMSEAPVFISSGYRHPALNADPSIGGAHRSQHIAGRAADIWSSEKTPGELAELALAITDCTIGIGLGGTFLHLDLRGELTSWVYEDAAMDEETFDHWVRTQCTPGVEPLSFDAAARMAAEQSEMRDAVLQDTLIGGYRDVMATYARAQLRLRGQGAVLLDLRPNHEEMGLPQRLTYIPAGSEMARQWNLEGLIERTDTNAYFVFTIIGATGDVTMGAMSYELALTRD